MDNNIEQPVEELNGAQFNSHEGSIIGKFKDATSLLNAYNNLQAEFTRKSQRLAQLEKTQAEQLSQNNDSALQPLEKAEDTEASENNSCLAETSSNKADLNAKILKYAENHPPVIECLEDVNKEFSNNANLSNLDNAVEIAYRLVKEKQKSEPADLVNNPEFIQQYVLSNNQITQMVIDNYVKSLAKNQTAPKLITGENKAMMFSPNENNPKTLADANKIFSKMLEK